jgi:hypothetical protein
MDDEDDEQELSLNPYLAHRAAKIARNQARLRELGLVNNRPTNSKLLQKTNGRLDPAEAVAIVSIRRSPRFQHDDRSQDQKAKRQRIVSAIEPVVSRLPLPNLNSSRPLPATLNLNPNSVRNMSIHVNDLVLGNSDFPNGLLGQRMKMSGKAYCMEISAERCNGSDSSRELSFNKYSGIQEWMNDALFLWVNLSGSHDIVNEFLEEGKKAS